jgi:hypothetical protein
MKNRKKINDQTSKSSTVYHPEGTNIDHAAVKVGADNMQIIRYHNQAFVPTSSKMMSREKASD